MPKDYMSMYELAGRSMDRPWKKTFQTETRHFLGIFPYKVTIETTSEVADIPDELFQRGSEVCTANLRGADIEHPDADTAVSKSSFIHGLPLLNKKK